MGGQPISMSQAQLKFMHFVKETREGEVYIYREQLRSNVLRGNYFFRFNLSHLINFDDQLTEQFRMQPAQMLKAFEDAVQEIYKTEIFDEANLDMEEEPSFQVQVHSDESPVMLRDL